MRIGYLVPQFPAQTHAFFWRELEQLEAQGAEVSLISTRDPGPDSCRHEFAAEGRRRTHYLYPPSPRVLPTLAGSLTKSPAVAGYLAGLTESTPAEKAKTALLLPFAYDLVRFAKARQLRHVHVHSCANAAHIAALARRLGGPSYSLTLHGHLPVYGKDHASKMGGAAFVATVTRPLHEAVVSEVGIPAERVPVVWMGVDTERFTPPPARERGPEDAFRMASIARLNPVKGHVHALRAMRIAIDEGRKLHYTIAGDGPERSNIEAAIAELGLEREVDMTGSVGREEVLRILRESHAFLLTSFGLGEAAPVAVMEAMAMGLPVVVSRIGGTEDMIDNERNGLLVDQRNEDQILDAMRRLHGDPALAGRLGGAARERALEVFDFRKTAKKLLDRIGAVAP